VVPNNEEPPEKAALTTAADFIKYTTALGTGTLVFSAGLTAENVDLSGFAKACLIASWLLLAISVALGVLTYSRIPIKLAEKNYDTQDKWFSYPGRLHQLTFLAGIACLGVALIGALI